MTNIDKSAINPSSQVRKIETGNEANTPEVVFSARPLGELSNFFEQQIKLVNKVPEYPAHQRTSSLGPRRPPPGTNLGSGLKQNPFLRPKPELPPAPRTSEERGRRFNKVAKELQSSLTELNRLIDDDKAAQLDLPVISLAERRASFNQQTLQRPKRIERTCGWDPEVDLKEMAASVNDLRSRFEVQPSEMRSRAGSSSRINTLRNPYRSHLGVE